MLAPARKVIKDTITAPARKVTKDTITSNSPSAISELHKLPKTKDTDVWFLSGCDRKFKFFEKVAYEFKWAPFINKRHTDPKNTRLFKKERFIMIIVSGFNEDCPNFLYVIKGPENMTKFLKMVFSGRPYDEPCFATPLHVSSHEKLVDTAGLERDQYERVIKTETKGMRWGYFYASAEKAFEQLEFNAAKFNVLHEALTNLNKPIVEPISDTDEDDDTVGLANYLDLDDESTDEEFSDDEDEDMKE